jgi:BirA family biotin operon repressor/biotin-[acetyl-CoA-carboxylase] ligase
MPYDYESDAAIVKDHLNCVHIGSEILFLPEIDSTNNLAKKHSKNNAQEGLVIIAESQTGGRGRMGRSWHSPPETGIYLSILLKPNLKPDHLSFITLLAGVSAISTINEISHQRANLKWPNDILINDKKVCGLLCEMTQEKGSSFSVVIGIGINVNQLPEQFPKDLKKTATSLRIVNGSPINRLTVIQSLLTTLDREYRFFLAEGGHSVIKKWKLNTDLFGKKVSVKRGSVIITGTAMNLDELGRLVLRRDNGHAEVIDSGEVTLG